MLADGGVGSGVGKPLIRLIAGRAGLSPRCKIDTSHRRNRAAETNSPFGGPA